MAQATAASKTASETTPTVQRQPDRNLALDLLRVTEAAAMAAGRWVGRRDSDGADAAAVAAMRAMMVTVAMDGVVVMDKLVAGTDAVGVVDIRHPRRRTSPPWPAPSDARLRTSPVCVLDRPRHDELAHRVTSTGARIKFITDGDVGAAVMAATPDSGVDLLLGIGGTPEGVITACAIQCLGGVLQGRLHPRSEEEKRRADEAGLDLDVVLTADDLVSGDDAFFVMTGITTASCCTGCATGGTAPSPSHW